MFCKHCGTELPDDARFCVACGTEVESFSVAAIDSVESASTKESLCTDKVENMETSDIEDLDDQSPTSDELTNDAAGMNHQLDYTPPRKKTKRNAVIAIVCVGVLVAGFFCLRAVLNRQMLNSIALGTIPDVCEDYGLSEKYESYGVLPRLSFSPEYASMKKGSTLNSYNYTQDIIVTDTNDNSRPEYTTTVTCTVHPSPFYTSYELTDIEFDCEFPNRKMEPSTSNSDSVIEPASTNNTTTTNSEGDSSASTASSTTTNNGPSGSTYNGSSLDGVYYCDDGSYITIGASEFGTSIIYYTPGGYMSLEGVIENFDGESGSGMLYDEQYGYDFEVYYYESKYLNDDGSVAGQIDFYLDGDYMGLFEN